MSRGNRQPPESGPEDHRTEAWAVPWWFWLNYGGAMLVGIVGVWICVSQSSGGRAAYFAAFTLVVVYLGLTTRIRLTIDGDDLLLGSLVTTRRVRLTEVARVSTDTTTFGPTIRVRGRRLPYLVLVPPLPAERQRLVVFLEGVTARAQAATSAQEQRSAP